MSTPTTNAQPVDDTAGLVSHATLEEIPILDVGPYLAGEPGALAKLAAEIRHASTKIGFYFIVNHGMAQDAVDRSFDASRKFFALPAEKKMKIRMNEHQCGWQPPKEAIHGDSFDKVNKPQVTEAFKFTLDLTPTDPDYGKNKRYRGHNQWSEDVPPDVNPNLMAFLISFEALGKRLLPPLAVSLGVEPSFFDRHFERSSSMMRVAYYPVMQVDHDQLGLPGHTDLSFLSMIPPATAPGLQILTQSGLWIDQPAIPEAILVNTGDTLRRWTNDLYLATPHRVLAAKNADRYSNIFFFYPNVGAVMECIPTCADAATPAKYKPVTFGEFHAGYSSRNFAYAEKGD